MHLLVMSIMFLLITACAPKAVFIQGGEKASAVIDITATGGKIELRGPFVYCADSMKEDNPGATLLNCPTVDGPLK